MGGFAVLIASVYLVTLGVAAITSPERIRTFLAHFAGSPSAHFLELSIRLVIGTAFILHGPEMRFAPIFSLFGWVLVVTTVALALIPWTVHRRFAAWSVPMATRNMPLFGLSSIAAGLFVLHSLLSP